VNIAYPFHLGSDGLVAAVSDAEHVEQMIEQLLFTLPGERVNRPDFGAPVAQFVFRRASDETAAAIQFMVQGALQQWLGDVIEVQEVQVNVDESALVVTIRYLMRANQQVRVARFRRP
jgi:phage baseplate assembly protein W